MKTFYLPIVLLVQFALSLKQEKIHCPAQCATTVFAPQYSSVATITITETKTFTYNAPPQYYTSQPEVITITETKWEKPSSEPAVYPSWVPPPKYSNTTTCTTSKGYGHKAPHTSIPPYYGSSSASSIAPYTSSISPIVPYNTSTATSASSIAPYSSSISPIVPYNTSTTPTTTLPSTCNDQCAYAVSTAIDGCSSLFATTVYPTTVTSTVFATSIRNTTIFPVVSTETDIETDSFTESTTSTTGTTTMNTIVATNTVTDSTVTITATTGTTTITQQGMAKRNTATGSACTNSAQYSSACSCAGVSRTTITMPTPTLTVTAIINGTFTAINNVTSTTSTTTSVTTTVTSEIEATTTQELTATVDTTATTTTNIEATTTTTLPAVTYIPCTGPPFNTNSGSGGCSSNCYCDALAGSSDMGFCDNAVSCGPSCQTTADCPSGFACTSGHPECGSANVCIDYTGCSASAARIMFAARGVPALGRMREGPLVVEKREIELLRGVNTDGKGTHVDS